MTALLWLRDDLRLRDNPALVAAAEHGPVTAVYLLDEASPGIRPLGGATKWWLHESLRTLATDLEQLGVPLVLRRGAAAEVIPALVRELGATGVFWNRRYGGVERDIDASIKSALREAGVHVASSAANLLFEPWTVQTGSGGPYGVFTPFWKACLAGPVPRQPLELPQRLVGGAGAASDSLDEWTLQPRTPDWAGGLRESWTPGERGAHDRLAIFLETGLPAYADGRDFTDRDVTSRLSPHLRFGEISPFQVWHAAATRREAHPEPVRKFLSEVGWREFAWHVLFHFPELANRNWKPQFDAFPWERPEPLILRAWQRGNTGVDLVDAGMRELWHTGTMHNRVRMVVASFLTKNLRIDWRLGEAWFWDTLVDADAASNPFSWQWVAGSGADAAPYFRVFNPELQAEKFDPQGRYRARWLGTELRPSPIVDLKASRDAALAAYDVISRAAKTQ
ncbi:MAG TPA: deoxyribodipyrimidine photo-lyase [Microbacteriaceae bacterium]|nr:deoxyribodipyrimidine photo-lyase [Microbacteriaceae bacterium]